MEHCNLMAIDKACLDNVDNDVSTSIPWYILGSYGRSHDDPILTDSRLERLSKTIIDNWDKIDHEYKEYLRHEDLRYIKYTGEYPNRTQQKLKTIKEVYCGREKH